MMLNFKLTAIAGLLFVAANATRSQPPSEYYERQDTEGCRDADQREKLAREKYNKDMQEAKAVIRSWKIGMECPSCNVKSTTPKQHKTFVSDYLNRDTCTTELYRNHFKNVVTCPKMKNALNAYEEAEREEIQKKEDEIKDKRTKEDKDLGIVESLKLKERTLSFSRWMRPKFNLTMKYKGLDREEWKYLRNKEIELEIKDLEDQEGKVSKRYPLSEKKQRKAAIGDRI